MRIYHVLAKTVSARCLQKGGSLKYREEAAQCNELARRGGNIRLGCRNVGHLSFSANLPITTIGVYAISQLGDDVLGLLGELGSSLDWDLLITRTGACMMATGRFPPVYELEKEVSS